MTDLPLMVSPRDGEVDVPTNAIVSLRWEAWPTGGPAELVTLMRAIDGAVVPVAITRVAFANFFVIVLRLEPQAPLDAGMQYQVLRSDGTAIGVFTTGASSDVTPPDPPTVMATVGPARACNDDLNLCCYATDARLVMVEISAAEPAMFLIDGMTETLVSDAEVNGPELRGLAMENPSELECKRMNRVFEVPAGDQVVQVRLRDRAGNESAPVDLQVDARFETGGCGCRLAPRRPIPSAWGLAMFLLVVLSRSVRRSPPASPKG